MSDVQKIDAIKELKDNLTDSIVLETLRTINSNMDCYRDKMLGICQFLNREHGINADGIKKILDGVSDNYVFYLMHGNEYAQWTALGIDCQKYADKKTLYVSQNYDKLKH